MHLRKIRINLFFRSFCTNFAAKIVNEVTIMATIVLQVPDENLVSKVKQACKMLMGVASVKVLGKRTER